MNEAAPGPVGEQPDGSRVAAAGAWVVAFGLCFGLLALLPIDVPVYVPIEHRWQMGMPDPPAVGMDFYGRVLVSLLVALVTAALAWALARFALHWRPEPSSTATRMLWLYALAATALPLFLYAYTLLFK